MGGNGTTRSNSCFRYARAPSFWPRLASLRASKRRRTGTPSKRWDAWNRRPLSARARVGVRTEPRRSRPFPSDRRSRRPGSYTRNVLPHDGRRTTSCSSPNVTAQRWCSRATPGNSSRWRQGRGRAWNSSVNFHRFFHAHRRDTGTAANLSLNGTKSALS